MACTRTFDLRTVIQGNHGNLMPKQNDLTQYKLGKNHPWEIAFFGL